MNFIYKIKHKKSGLYLMYSGDIILDDIGYVYTSYPHNVNLNVPVRLGKNYEPDSFETKTEDWIIEEFACILHDSHAPVESVNTDNILTFGGTVGLTTFPQIKRNQ